ncbi:ATP-binding protein [Streptomyces sp. SID3343]|uniref:ATP-binding protein n=1 Tax=Streptomyces sp. SID3343 TaxID=2690260 RepID=UPI001371D8E6|nr:ATP-binding protein [Streptomyces sp. SID3343]MYW01416.1 ATP-binding protein [Streptomyces sp. SID3343]
MTVICATAKFALTREPGAVSFLRRSLRWFVAALGLTAEPMAEDMLLCASELTTNSVLHAEGTKIIVEASWTARGTLRLEVSDTDRTTPVPTERPAGDCTVGGRGLPILAATGDWGTWVYHWGKTVWWEARRPSVPIVVG